MLDQPSGVSEERSVVLKLMLSVMVVVLLSTLMEDAHMLDQPSGVSEEKSVTLMLKLTEDGNSATTNYLVTPIFPDPESVTIQVENNVEPKESVMLMLTEDMDSATTNYPATLTLPDPESVTIQVGNNVEPVESDQLDGVIITMLCQVTPISKDLE